MAASVDSTLEPLLSPTSPSSSTSSTIFSFPTTQSQTMTTMTTTLEHPSLPPSPAGHEDIPSIDKPETTRVLVRNLSRRGSLRNKGTLPTFTVTKVSKIEAAQSPVLSRQLSMRGRPQPPPSPSASSIDVQMALHGHGRSHMHPTSNLPTFVECANETEQKTPPPSPPSLSSPPSPYSPPSRPSPYSPPSPPSLYSPPSSPSPTFPYSPPSPPSPYSPYSPSSPPSPPSPPSASTESASPPFPSFVPDSPSDSSAPTILRHPPLRRQGNAYSSNSKYSHFHSGLKRIRQTVEDQINAKVLRQSIDSSGSPEVFFPGTTDSRLGRADRNRGSKSSAASQSDIFNLCQKDSADISRTQLREVAKRGRLFAKRKKFRLVHQTGECNIQYVNVDKRGARFLLDIFTTLVALPWRYNIFVYLVSFLSTWLLFALVWWALHSIYGVDEEGNPCVQGVHSFTTAFLYSIETQHTIGYGSRYITDRCPPAVCMLILQSVFGAVMQCVVTGIVFAKLARPNRRAETIMFSKKAVIRRDHNDTLCFVFRVGDMRSSQLIGVNIHTVLVHKHINSEKSTIHLEQECLRTTTEANRRRHYDDDDDSAGFYFLAWPIKVIHRIDERSPLWNLSPNDLLVASFEIVVVLEATCEATGATIQVRTSYLPSEILWGHSLVSLLTCQKDNGRFKVDYSQFHQVTPVYTPEVSACELSENKHLYKHPTDSVEIIDEMMMTTTTFNTAQPQHNNNNNSVNYKILTPISSSPV